MFGHWRNPEYQELCQEAEMIEREKQEMSEQAKDNNSTDDEDWLPF
jgi:predicted ATP-grasp superfamily ATP-dependent carboligase